MTVPIDAAEETFECVRLVWSTDDEVDRGLGRGTGISERGGLVVGRRFGMECLDTLQGVEIKLPI